MAHLQTREDYRTDRGRHDGQDRSLSELIKELRDESSHLLRQEVALAKAEMSEKISNVGRNTGFLTTGGVVAMTGVLFLAMAATVGIYNGLVAADLSRAVSGWLAPFITGLVLAGIGYALVQKAINALKDETPVPERTVASMQDNTQWVKEKVTQ